MKEEVRVPGNSKFCQTSSEDMSQPQSSRGCQSAGSQNLVKSDVNDSKTSISACSCSPECGPDKCDGKNKSVLVGVPSIMKSSKIENIFNYNPPLEDPKPLSPFTYYQPFQSSFDPEFTVQPPKATPRQTAPQLKRWSQSIGERPVGGLRVPGGSVLNPWDPEAEGFAHQSPSHMKGSFPSASTSWGEPEGRSLFNSTWHNPPPSMSLFSPHEEAQTSKYFMSGVEGLGMHSQFPPKNDTSFFGLGRSEVGFGCLDGAGFRMGSAFGQASGHGGSIDAGLTHSSHYPLMLGSLRKNITQNLQKTAHSRPMMCNFCKNNKEVPDIYLNHYLYDPETKILSCPVLRKHVCEICGGTGDQAHTLQYCPVNRERGLQSKVPVLLKTRTITNSTGKIRRH